jgi:hypothetical protein
LQNKYNNPHLTDNKLHLPSFEFGAKWQAERMYSREQVIELFNKYVEDIENPISSKFKGFHEWIQQNLKK